MQNQVFYDAWSSVCKTPFGAIRECEPVTIRFNTYQPLFPKYVTLILRQDGGTMLRREPLTLMFANNHSIIFETTFFVEEKGLYFYRFEVETEEGILFVGRGENATAIVGDFLPEWQLTVYSPDFETPKWLQGGLMYQIFPDRFFRDMQLPLEGAKNERFMHEVWGERPLFVDDVPDYEATDFFGGNLSGITQKLSYLLSLGITALYLNPIFEAASNHRYNTADYKKIDPYLGDLAAFKQLCLNAKRLGIGIILDGVFSHTGSDSIYFNREGHYDAIGAYQSADSPYASWYTFSTERESYDCWWGFTTLPNVKETDPAFLEFICGKEGVLQYWLELGVKGWRLDVADELPDEFLFALRQSVKHNHPEAYILGEVWEDASNKSSYDVRRPYLLGEQLDSVMNYPWRAAILEFLQTNEAVPFYNSIMAILDHYPAPALQVLMTPISTHDTARALTVLGVQNTVEREVQGLYKMTEMEYENGKLLLQFAALLQYTLPGVPCLYYGDEVGLSGFSDPWNRCCYPWGSEDEDLLLYFRELGKLRTHYKDAFCKEMQFVYAYGKVIAYKRGEQLLITLNRSGQSLSLRLPAKKVLLSIGEAELTETEVTIHANSGAVFLL